MIDEFLNFQILIFCFVFVIYILGSLKVEEEYRKRQGLCSTLNIVCTKCGQKTPFQTFKNLPGPGKAFDVNRRATFVMNEIGQGRKAMADICSVFNMPPPSHSDSWSQTNDKLLKTSREELEKECNNAANRLRTLHMNEDETRTITDDTIIDVPVSFDGTWHHRGFKSSHGLGVAMSVDTGEVLDVEVLSKECVDCRRMKSRGYDSDDDDYMIWEYHHFEGGYCNHNYEGPSGGMEQESAKVTWGRSLARHKLRYTAMLCDGDSKALNDLNTKHKPYGDIEIQKLDCVNHVHKRMGKGLRNLRKTSSVVKGGAAGLTDALITSLTDYYRAAIMKNTTSSKDPAEITEAVNKMKTEIVAGLYHTVEHENPDIQHQYCSVDWCKYLQSKRDGTTLKPTKRNRLPFRYLSEMLPLYQRLSDPKLLERCVPGWTQNQNEAFNHTVWQRCSKEKYSSSKAVERAVSSAVLCWNIGGIGRRNLMNRSGIPAGFHTSKALLSMDTRRLNAAAACSSEQEKKKRKHQKEEHLKEEQRQRALKGDGYGAGQFND